MQISARTSFLAFIVGIFLLGCASSDLAFAQGTQKPTPPAKPAEDCGCDEPQAAGPQVWAVVNGTRIYDTELKDALAPQVDPLLKQLQDLRQQGLEDLINRRLIDKEAKGRGLSRADFLRARIDSKLQPPTDADIQAWIDKNGSRVARDPASSDYRRDVALYLKEQNRAKEIRSLGEQLRKKSEVNILPQANAADAEPVRVLAIVDGEPIRRSDLDESIKAPAYELKRQIYDLRKQALDRKIHNLLLEQEATRKGLTQQRLYSREVLDKAPLVTVEQADAFYAANRGQIPQPLEAVRAELIAYLRQQAVSKEEQRFTAELRKAADVKISLPGIVEPLFKIDTKGKPSLGAQNAPVTVVEFTDYECPRCGEIQPLIKEVLAAYPNKVRLVVREFPLTRHAYARKAAQAALCAFEQGKYWEYTALLFKNQTALDETYLLQYAASVGMDKALLASHLKSAYHDRAVQEDLDEGFQVGVNGTPSFHVNGRRLEDRSLEGFKQAIDRALSPRN